MTHARSRFATVALAIGLATTLVGCTTGSADTTPPSPDAPPSSGETAPESDAPGTETTMENAGRIATDKYGGTITSVEDDDHKGEPAWEVELRGSTEGSLEVKVSKATGEILDVEQD